MSKREGKRSGKRVCRAKRARQQPKNKCRAQVEPGAGGGSNLSMVEVKCSVVYGVRVGFGVLWCPSVLSYQFITCGG